MVRRTHVLGVRDVTPRMRRVTVGGAQLGAFDGHAAWTAPGFDDHMKLIFASDGDVLPALPVQVEHGIEWRASDTRRARDYTPRAVRSTPDGTEVDLDFVLHGDGPAASWALTAKEGDDLWFVGPKSSTVLPDELDWILLAGDETALPAIGRFLDERPVECAARIVVTIDDPVAVQELALREGDRIAWLDGRRGSLEAGVRTALEDAEGTGYVWAAAESGALLPLRRYTGRELRLPKSHVNITGYWHHEAEEGADAAAPGTSIAPPVSPIGWLATRCALRLGLIDVLAETPGLGVEPLAERLRVAVASLRVLIPVLRQHDVLKGDDDALELGGFGDVLVDEEHVREEFDGREAETMLALEHLSSALRQDVPAVSLRSGRTLAAQAEAEPDVYSELVGEAARLAFLLDGFVADPVWSELESVAFAGPGAAVVLDAVRAVQPHLRVGLNDSTAATTALRAETAEADVADVARAQLAVAAFALAHRTDDEAREELTRLRGVSSRAVVIESSRMDELAPGAAEHALLIFAQTGAGARDLPALASAAGWRVERTLPLGWGVEAVWLRSAV